MKIDLIKAWKDEEYRSTLTQDQLNQIQSPVADITLSDEEMNNVNGGVGSRRALCWGTNTQTGDGQNDDTFNCCQIV